MFSICVLSIVIDAARVSRMSMVDQNVFGNQETLIQSLIATIERGRHPVQVFETHISWVLVAGKYAYKFKKALHLDFLDFSTLDARHFYCKEEWRLNRRLASDMYLGVVAITGSATHPVIGGGGTPIEYAVKMRAFPQRALWSSRIEKNCLSEREIDDLGRTLANFHQGAAVAPKESAWGSCEALQKSANENLDLAISMARNTEEKRKFSDLKTWHMAQLRKLRTVFEKRKAEGSVRECHGDLHSGNILTIDDQVTVFDCIEFNESLRWIDVMNDLAFIYMDLKFHGLHALAARLLNGYLQIAGDYEGLAVLRYYQIQRALVRCKVNLLRSRQLEAHMQAATPHQTQAAEYLAFCLQNIGPAPSAIVIMHGYSGSGKSVFSMQLVEIIGALQIRSDVERKRLLGIRPSPAGTASLEKGIYARAATHATYDRLRMLALCVADSGMPVIVDAAFLKRQQRKIFEEMAIALGLPFFIIDIHASEATLQARVAGRAQLGNDPSDAGLEVLTHQLQHSEALSDDEKKYTICIDSDAGLERGLVQKACEPIIVALRNSAVDYS
ncbi:MAG TPA: AAA family ATPase [Burkholderiaceae bacterium]|nr:AAA family ATPase [Burkholderiaceae bacterium]